MATTVRSTALDFDRIKTALAKDLAASNEFPDFDFEASGISNILDVLAYNTHLNGLIANFATNESFMRTAQLRSSIVSRAEELGLNIRSNTASSAVLRISVNLSTLPVLPTTIKLPQYTEYTATLDGVTYSFYTLEEYTAENNGQGIYTFENDYGNGVGDDTDYHIPVYQGDIKTKNFYVGTTDDYQVYVIPDTQMDTSSARVYVYDTPTSNSYEEYTSITKAITVNSNSTYYDLREAPNGAYELTFGDGQTYGKTPSPGSKIVVTYLRPDGEDANGSADFFPQSTLTYSGVQFDQGVTTFSNSTGGKNKQTIEQIRQTAPIAFASQQRLVTPEDYQAQILSNFSQVDEVAAWGGQDNIPIDYGKVYISLQFNDGTDANTQTRVKAKIVSDLTDKLSVTSITPKFVDPVNVYLECTVDFNYDPDLTGLTAGNMATKVTNIVNNYFNTIDGFEKTFRRSNMLTTIDEAEEAILSSKADVKMRMRFEPEFGSTATFAYTINFPVPLAEPDDVNYIIRTTNFEITGATAYIRNKLNSTQLELVNAVTNEVITSNVGAYYATKGEVWISEITPLSSSSGGTYIEVRATPYNQSVIKPLRNYIIKLDKTRLVTNALRDDQNTKVTL